MYPEELLSHCFMVFLVVVYRDLYAITFTFFIHSADAFIQSDLYDVLFIIKALLRTSDIAGVIQ